VPRHVPARAEGALPHPPTGIARHPPGSDWSYLKLYGGVVAVEELLRDDLGPVVRAAMASGAADRWFFVRNADPAWHLRLRVHGQPDRLSGDVLPELLARARSAVAAGRLDRVQVDTYEPELERYGGTEGIALAERIFRADSDAVLTILGQLRGASTEHRWCLALVGVDGMLSGLGLGRTQKRGLVAQLRQSLVAERAADKRTERELARRYRERRTEIEALLGSGAAVDPALAGGIQALRERDASMAPAVAALRATITDAEAGEVLLDHAASYVHMHLNRMFRTGHRAEELVIYDFLARAYASQIAWTPPA
jgi:thiopeptide-type bacteriocin biosynthesis protein